MEPAVQAIEHGYKVDLPLEGHRERYAFLNTAHCRNNGKPNPDHKWKIPTIR